MRKKKIIRSQVLCLLFSSSVAIIACFAANDDSKEQKYAIVNIENDEEQEIQVYIQSGDGKSIGTSSYQISLNVPPKGDKGAKKQIKVRKSQMGGKDTFSVIGGTGTFDKIVSFDNRCKGLRFGSKHEVVFKPAQTGMTVCEAKSTALSSSEYKRSFEPEPKQEEKKKIESKEAD